MLLAPVTVPVIVTAFAGDSAILEQTLQQLAVNSPPLSLRVLGSDDAALAAVAHAAQLHWTPGLPSECPADSYWLAVLQLLRNEPGPVIVLRAGTLLPLYWYARLVPPSHLTEPAAFFPLSVRHPCTTIFQDSAEAPGLAVTELDTWLNQHAPRCIFDLPALSGWTAWIDPRCCALDGMANDATLAAELIQRGKLLLASDALVVDDSRFPSCDMPAMYPAWRDNMLRHHPLSVMRHALSQRAARSEPPPPNLAAVKPVRLHLSHGWGGGLWRWVEDFMAADRGCHNLVLRPVGEPDGFGKALVLYAADSSTALASWTLARPILSTAVAHLEYANLLQEIVARFAVNEVLISSLIGHSLEALQTGLPTTMVCHDFYPLCPLVTATWDGPCGDCDDERLRACLRHNPAKRFFTYEPDTYWQTLRSRFVALAQANSLRFVAPTPSVAARWRALAPDLPAERFAVIPHGLPAPLLDDLAQARAGGDTGQAQQNRARPKVVVLGSLDVHKGGAILREVLPSLTAMADLLLLGVGDSGAAFEQNPGVTVVREYRREELGRMLAEQHPDLGLLLSTVPETFSYTLSELQAAAIPVAATQLGAFADRMVHDADGWLFAPDSNSLRDLLQALLQSPERIAAARSRLLTRQPRNAGAMVADYDSHSSAELARARVRRPYVAIQPVPPATDAAVEVAAAPVPSASDPGAPAEPVQVVEENTHRPQRSPGRLKSALQALLRAFT